jgi:protein-disulfide isomerase
MSTRQEIRDKRKKEQTRKRLISVMFVAGTALLIAAVLIVPGALSVGDFIQVTPQARFMEQGTALGDPEAPVLIEVFEDFLCPACNVYNQEVAQLLKAEYVDTGQAYYVFRQYPFLAPESFQAANASMCAAEQNRFWDYHDILFANQVGESRSAFTDARLEAYAESLGLDMDRFETCFEDQATQTLIEADILEALDRGLTGTPAVFVNGEQIAPGFVPQLNQMRIAIEAALDES